MAKKKAKGKKPARPLVGAGGVLNPTGINFLIKTRDLLKGKKGFQKDGGIIKASSGKMTESDLQKKVDRDARINKARKSIKKQKQKDPFQTSLAQLDKLRQQREMAPRITDKEREMRRIGKATGVSALGPIGAMPDKELKQRMQGMSKGGMCRGMGAAIRGGDFKGVK